MPITSNQLALLMKIIDENKVIKTHKSLQKIIYLSQAQAKTSIWQFKWFHFGPFSPTLQTVFHTAVNYKLLKYSLKNGEISINRNNELIELYLGKKLSERELLLLKAIKSTIQKLGDKICYNPEKLELIASLYYLYKKEGDLEKAKELLFSLKNNASYHDEIEVISPQIIYLIKS